MKKSLEVEYWVVDDDGALAPAEPLLDGSEYVEEEFVAPLIELKTPPCETVDDLRETFVRQIESLVERAREHDRLLVPLGTPLCRESVECLPSERTRVQERVLGSSFAYAKHCAGTHLHFEKRNVTDQLNALIAMDPASALVNSSPYYDGRRVAACARGHAYRKKGYEQFPKHGQLWEYVETVAEWERRLDRRYEEFEAAAVAAGVDEAVVREQFTPDDVVWTPVRLRDEMPTVEWRSPDSALPSQILRLAEEADALMERIHHANVTIEGTFGGVTSRAVRLPEFDHVRGLVDAAMYDGIESAEVDAYLRRLDFDVDAYDPCSSRIDDGPRVSRARARQVRRQYGQRLERDVRALSERSRNVPA